MLALERDGCAVASPVGLGGGAIETVGPTELTDEGLSGGAGGAGGAGATLPVTADGGINSGGGGGGGTGVGSRSVDTASGHELPVGGLGGGGGGNGRDMLVHH